MVLEMKHFSYYSEQVHSVGVNGKQKTRKNIVNIKNNKGKKIIEETVGKSITRKQKKLSKKEINHIRQNRFIPGLFRKL
jgi:hypothetical protein